MYCEVTRLSNTVSFPSVTATESLVQVTLVAGPSVEIQVRVKLKLSPSRSKSTVISLGILTIPKKRKRTKELNLQCIYNVHVCESLGKRQMLMTSYLTLIQILEGSAIKNQATLDMSWPSKQ